MDDILLTRALIAEGYDPDELARLLRRGELTRIRRGAYARPSDPEAAESRDQQRRRLVVATLPQLDQRAVVSHGSAALLHRLPTWPEAATERVHVTRDRRGGSRRRSLVEVHGAPLASLTWWSSTGWPSPR